MKLGSIQRAVLENVAAQRAPYEGHKSHAEYSRRMAVAHQLVKRGLLSTLPFGHPQVTGIASMYRLTAAGEEALGRVAPVQGARKKSPRQLDHEIAEMLARASSKRRSHATKKSSMPTPAIDTTETLDRKFQSRRHDALTLSEKARQARGAAARWMKRSSTYAREGEFREADEAETEAVALGRMAADLEAEASSLRTARH